MVLIVETDVLRLCVLKHNWEVQESPSPAAGTRTASHLPASHAAQGQDAPEQEPPLRSPHH